jgi:tripartite-type tricarboxylate transporter receptor subunit TctC
MRATPLIVITVAVVVVAGTMLFKRNAPRAPWPQKAVTLLVPISAGSGIDLSARLFAERLAKKWNQPVVIDNRPGGGDGVLGFSIFAAGKDDHTLLFTASGPITMDALIRDDLPFDARTDFVPIAAVAQPTIVIAASTTLSVTSLKELESLATKNPGKYFWSGIGQLGKFFEAFLKLEKLEMNYVPYRTTPEAVQDLAAGRLHIWLSSIATVDSQLRAGSARILAVTNSNRSVAIPAVQTVSEAGFPNLTLDGIWGFYGWRGIPDSLREKISEDVHQVATDPELVARMTLLGVTVDPSTPDELTKLLEQQRSQFGNVIELLGLKSAK